MGVDFRSQLAKQLRFLHASCREYDAGHADEAVRIATALRVMFHRTASSTSLLAHLGATATPMLSTCAHRPRSNRVFWPGLFRVEMDVEKVTMRCLPYLGSRPIAHRTIPFCAWWEETVLFAQSRRITRRSLTLDAANKDGGAHVDATLTPDYQWMVDGSGMKLTREFADGLRVETGADHPHLASLRQIAFEVLNSPDLLRLAGGDALPLTA
jgi:hypothetical protein